MKDRAYAKINLCLDVAGRRDDGYHELKMIMVPIDFYDVLEMYPASETSLSLNRSFLPVNEKNTIIKAVRIMQETFNIDTGFACTLQKHIPTRAGLAGGSADAAAAIRMINKLMNLRLSFREMAEVAEKVGADVPFCIYNVPAVVQGFGEIIMPFHCRPDFGVLLVKPKRGVSTREAFEIVDGIEQPHPDVDAMRDALICNDYDKIISSLGNSLEIASLQLVKEIRYIKEKLVERGFDGALMSGSGSTVFGITRDMALLEEVMEEMKAERFFVRKTRIMGY